MSQLNIFGEEISECCTNPITGFTRDGFCSHHPLDHGLHLFCALMTKDFLEFSKSKGNDLSTPRPEFNFPGLNEGDAWCLCSMRWLEAYQHASAPKLYLRRTHQEALSVIDLDILQNFALDLN